MATVNAKNTLVRRNGKVRNGVVARRTHKTPTVAQMAQPDLAIMTPDTITSSDMTFAFNRYGALVTQAAHTHVNKKDQVIDVCIPSHAFLGDFNLTVHDTGKVDIKGSSKSVALARIFALFGKNPTPDTARMVEMVGTCTEEVAAPAVLNEYSDAAGIENPFSDEYSVGLQDVASGQHLENRRRIPEGTTKPTVIRRDKQYRPKTVRVSGIERDYDPDGQWSELDDTSDEGENMPIRPALYTEGRDGMRPNVPMSTTQMPTASDQFRRKAPPPPSNIPVSSLLSGNSGFLP